MLEKVARAICRAQTHSDGGDYWQAFMPEAQAAITALREPSDAMMVAGGLKCESLMFEGEASGVIFKDMGVVFTAMVDAAAKENAACA